MRFLKPHERPRLSLCLHLVVRWSSQLLLQCYPCLLSHTSYNDGLGLTLGKSRSSSSTTFPGESYRNIHSSQVERAPIDRHQFCVPPAWQTRALTGVSYSTMPHPSKSNSRNVSNQSRSPTSERLSHHQLPSP